MSYRIRFRTRAKEELQRAKRYGSDFSNDLDQWLNDIATSAANQSTSDSIDLLQLLEKGVDLAGNPGSWKHMWKKWWAARSRRSRNRRSDPHAIPSIPQVSIVATRRHHLRNVLHRRSRCVVDL